VQPRAMDGFVRLIEQKYFTVDRFDVASGKVRISSDGPACLVGLSGGGVVKSAHGSTELKPGQAVVLPLGSENVAVEASADLSFIRCMAPV
jgi:mannose-6-phosphate isomerase